MKIGCHILDHKNSMVHVSGHPSKKNLKLCMTGFHLNP